MTSITQRNDQSPITVAYMRTATRESQTTRRSLERQWQACEEHARAQGNRVDHVYVDIAVSGLSRRRPALTQLLGDLTRGRIGRVVTADPDRIARDRHLEQDIRRAIQSKGATISSPCDERLLSNRKETN